jgi:hypothetical protein
MHEDRAEALRVYETTLFERAEDAARRAFEILAIGSSQNALETMVKRLSGTLPVV